MISGAQNILKIPELKRRIGWTLLFLAIYRVGVHIPTPGINSDALASFFAAQKGTLFSLIDMFSGGALERLSVFALGIMPYISASIIFQLLASVYPPLEKLQKEGESGRKKINEYTRYATVVLCLGQSWFYVNWLVSSQLVRESLLDVNGYLGFGWQFTAVMIMTAGTTSMSVSGRSPAITRGAAPIP